MTDSISTEVGPSDKQGEAGKKKELDRGREEGWQGEWRWQQRPTGRWGRLEKVGNCCSLPCDGHRSDWRGCQRRIRNQRGGNNKEALAYAGWMIKRVEKSEESVDGTTGYLVISRVSIQLSRELSSKVLKSQMPLSYGSNFRGEPIYKLPEWKNEHTLGWLDGKTFQGSLKVGSALMVLCVIWFQLKSDGPVSRKAKTSFCNSINV